jgi:hypothetical protein
MNTHMKALVAGLAILMAGAAFGWGASRLSSHAQPATSQNPSALAQSQETPSGNLTPQIQFHSVRSSSRTPAAVHRTVRGLGLAAGTPVAVSLHTSLSSKTAYAGQSWSGVVTEPVYRNGREVIPAGSTVRGVVAVAQPAERGSRATLQLALRSVSVNGRSYSLRGSSEAVTAGSPRLRNVGAVAGGAAAGALLGKAIGHSGKATLIGALIGGGAGTAAVAASHGYQATIAAGREVQFTTG